MKIKLWQQVVIGMILGVSCGYLFPDYYYLAKPIATIYTNLIKMVVIPMVFFAILNGVIHISDIRSLGRIGIKASAIYIIVTVIAVAIGISLALLFKPGLGAELGTASLDIINTVKPQTISQVIVKMFPSNLVNAMAGEHTVQIVIFAFILGIALILTGEKANEAKKVIASLTSVVFKMVDLIIKTTPIGVFAIMMHLIGKEGTAIIVNLGKLAAVIMGGFAIQYLLFGLLLLMARLKPIHFYRKTMTIQSLAFATSSSKATIPNAIDELQEKLGVSQKVASFILPLGAAINMTGSAIYIAACALFFAQIAGIELSSYQYVILILTSTIGSIGAAGCPSGAVLMLGMVLPAIGLPITGIQVIMVIDRILDMFRTVINVTGDCAVTVVVDKVEKSLDVEKYNQ